ncbi:ester cyclase [Streptomyces sp. NRRL S-87]|uniref:ester cyclase n=1 Tax=Streptomyces sp. NRRL S-87 TaxID=1463920 RepID=UPI0004BF7E58|nr:nuclear transport factor 2 family protein [Streptomyces sp. NRRL S-87]
MGQAREVMDRLTAALTTTRDLKAVAACFAEDACAVTPDMGVLRGRDEVVEYFRQVMDAMPNATYEAVRRHETADTAIDEGFYRGRNTGPLELPSGELLPATHREVRIRGVDFATVADGLITEYRLYFDQLEFLEQLGLLPEPPD